MNSSVSQPLGPTNASRMVCQSHVWHVKKFLFALLSLLLQYMQMEEVRTPFTYHSSHCMRYYCISYTIRPECYTPKSKADASTKCNNFPKVLFSPMLWICCVVLAGLLQPTRGVHGGSSCSVGPRTLWFECRHTHHHVLQHAEA